MAVARGRTEGLGTRSLWQGAEAKSKRKERARKDAKKTLTSRLRQSGHLSERAHGGHRGHGEGLWWGWGDVVNKERIF